jgi:probable HAF family extracellular repeat protein
MGGQWQGSVGEVWMFSSRIALCLLSVILLVASPLAFAQGTYTQIDYPGAAQTSVYGVNTAGDVVGFYNNSSVGGVWHGFLLSGSVYTTIDYAPGYTNYLMGINDVGQIVGSTTDNGTGFLYDLTTQTFTTISVPHAGATQPVAINNAGSIAGFFYNTSSIYGFELTGSRYQSIRPSGISTTFAYGISASGTVVGFASGRNFLNFEFNDGKLTEVTIPNAPNAYLYGINPAGTELVGHYSSHGAVAGFVYQNKTLTTLMFPGAKDTDAVGVNSAGEVVGYFNDSKDKAHGFTWTPPAPAHKESQP